MNAAPLAYEADEELLRLAERGMKQAYAPYSSFAVGASLRTVGNLIFMGCNIENASLGLSLCAERVALSKAVSEGHSEITGMAIVAQGQFPLPCGACRQMLQEFAPSGIPLYIRDLSTNETKIYSSKDLLPEPFVLSSVDTESPS